MPELTELDVEKYTHGRLHRDADETKRLLKVGLGVARRYCGWHVTPVKTDDVVKIDGPGAPMLVLPTLRLVAITALIEDGSAVDVNHLEVSSRGLVHKKQAYPGAWPNGYLWSCRLGGIEVTMNHGYDDAPEWQSAVLSFIDRTSMDIGESGGQPRVIGPFQYDTAPRSALASAFSDAERMLLDMYRLEPTP